MESGSPVSRRRRTWRQAVKKERRLWWKWRQMQMQR